MPGAQRGQFLDRPEWQWPVAIKVDGDPADSPIGQFPKQEREVGIPQWPAMFADIIFRDCNENYSIADPALRPGNDQPVINRQLSGLQRPKFATE